MPYIYIYIYIYLHIYLFFWRNSSFACHASFGSVTIHLNSAEVCKRDGVQPDVSRSEVHGDGYGSFIIYVRE